MSTTKTTQHSLASLKLPRTVPALITYANRIVVAMTGNPSFPTPIPTLTAVTAAIDELQVAETAALARTKGAVTVRNEKRTALVALLKQLLAYVQAVADANVDNGPSVIESAGVCLLSPLQMLTFAHAEGERRKFAFEALWGELVPQAH